MIRYTPGADRLRGTGGKCQEGSPKPETTRIALGIGSMGRENSFFKRCET